MTDEPLGWCVCLSFLLMLAVPDILEALGWGEVYRVPLEEEVWDEH
jgi:hypothetical protein